MTSAFAATSASFDQAVFMADQAKNMPKIDKSNMKRIDETAQDFEAVFISEMVTHMFAGVKTNQLFGGGIGEEMFRSMVVNQYGKEMAANGGIGLADNIKRQLIELQSQQSMI